MNVWIWCVEIYVSTYIHDNVLEYGVYTQVHEWLYWTGWYRECDTGRERTVLVFMRALLGLWFIIKFTRNHLKIWDRRLGFECIFCLLSMSQVKTSFSSVRLVLTKHIWMDEYEVARFVLVLAFLISYSVIDYQSIIS